jgi:hypothetical protein
MTTNGADRLKVLVQVGIFLLQVLIFVFLNDIRTSIKDHDKRLGSIGRSRRWSNTSTSASGSATSRS